MSFTGKVENGVVVLPPEAKLPDGTKVEVTAVETDPFVEAIGRLAKSRPSWPADYAVNHGHYVSGEPKKV